MRYYRENPEEPIRHDWLEGGRIATAETSQAASQLGKRARGVPKKISEAQREAKRLLMTKINANRSAKRA